VTTIGVTPNGPVVAEDIRDVQNRTRHGADYAVRCVHPLRCQRGEAIQRGLACPSKTWITRTSMFCSSRWMAKATVPDRRLDGASVDARRLHGQRAA
jgi:hypothetical protein